MATQISQEKQFGGYNQRFKHTSSSLGCEMNFTIFFPDLSQDVKYPILYYLSGLTCTDENVIQKSGVQKYCAKHKIAFVSPDTSPRGLNIEGEGDSFDFGTGAGFYLNATQEKWKNYRMEDYIVKELPELLKKDFNTLDISNASVMGHSMGGHGAITLGLKNPSLYKSISALSPVSNPMTVEMFSKGFKGYLGEDQETWKPYDSSEVIKTYSGDFRHILADMGSADSGYQQGTLLPEKLVEAAKGNKNVEVELRIQDGYGHSYYFVSTYIEDHVNFHSKYLLKN